MDQATGYEIPPRPQILIDLNKQLESDNCTVDSISNIITKDLGISAQIIKTVNSPAFGLQKKIESLHHAVSLLGIGATSNITSAVCLKSALGNNKFLGIVWESSEKIALTSYFLSHSFNLKIADLSYMTALFHNCGMAILGIRNENYQNIMKEAYSIPTQKITDTEKSFLDTHHATVGYYVAKSWKLPQSVVKVISDHHKAEEFFNGSTTVSDQEKNLMAILKLSEHLSQTPMAFSDVTIDHEWDRIRELILSHLKCSDEDYEELKGLSKDFG